MCPSKETQRESRILRGFVCCRVKKHSVNHVFYEGLCAHLSGMLSLVSSPKIAPGQYSFHMKITIFWPGWGGAQEAPQEGKCTKRSPWKSFLATRICCKKRGLDDAPAQNPVFLRVFSCPCFQNPIFCMLFEKIYSPGGDPGGPWQDQIRPERLQKHRVLKTC